MIAIGIDPGARFVGIVARGDDRGARSLLGAVVLDRKKLPDQSMQAWVHYVTMNVGALLIQSGLNVDVIAVERAKAPNPHVRMTNPQAIIETGHVVGGILNQWRDALVIEPAGNGLAPDPAYPVGIRKGTRGLGGPTIHVRAAWDVAGTAITIWKQQQRGLPQ